MSNVRIERFSPSNGAASRPSTHPEVPPVSAGDDFPDDPSPINAAKEANTVSMSPIETQLISAVQPADQSAPPQFTERLVSDAPSAQVVTKERTNILPE